MKRLTKIRLIHWYHIQDETLPIRGSALFMGDNGSGKSTILDAIQFALIADLSQVKFNQAANENAARTLQGYTRWMTNSGSSKETHQYNRGDCTSYVLLEFTETLADGESVFTIGAVVDSFKDARDPRRLHFAANQTPIDEIPVYRPGTRYLLNTSEFRRTIATRKGFFGSQEPGAFRDDLLTRLGKLSPDFTKALVKAQAFKPLGQVQQFVTDFLLDPRPLETQSLQANLSHYKGLEQKALEAEKRVAQLGKIAQKGTDLSRAREEARSFKYLELRAMAGTEEDRMASLNADIETARSETSRAATDIEAARQRRSQCEQELGSVYRALSMNSTYQERERIRADIDRAEKELSGAKAGLANAEAKESELREILGALHASGLEPPSADIISWLKEQSYFTRKERDQAKADVTQLKAEGETLQARIADLKKGIRPYPKEAVALMQLIEDRLGRATPLLCELLEVNDERWQDAVEGYLNTRRFDIVPEPEIFRKALSLYEQTKRQLGIHGVGLIDSEKVLATSRPAKPGSLAEVLSSDNPYAKAYANFLMGDVIRCESEQDLRKHSRAITPTCMVYQNHAARQTPFHIYESWFIGAKGQARLLNQAEAQLATVLERFKNAADAVLCCEKTLALIERAENAARAASLADEIREQIAALENEISRLRKHYESIDTTEIAGLEAREKALRSERDGLNARIEELAGEAKRLEERRSTLLNDLKESTERMNAHFAQIALEFGVEGSEVRVPELEERYQVERSKRSPAQIREVYESQRKNRETRAVNLVNDLTQLRTEYNNLFGLSAPVQGEDISPYLMELDSWKNSYLPEYQQKIIHAKEAAMQQLMEDIVHKLRENLDLIPHRFDQINRALRGFHFGHDQYQFTYRVKPEYSAFERLIREAAQYERQPLFETNWRERFKDGGALEALFTNMVSGSSARVEEELKQYSDYREYYEYDLKILHSDGTSSLFSQVNKLKSGGETQAPYYIAVLASLYRLYRLQPEHAAKQRGTIGLVLLDEAFNKMDEDRLRATLDFTRKLGLQLIMATPKERAEFIIPHVETCWLVAKDPKTGLAFLQDFHQELPEPFEEGSSPDDSRIALPS